MFRPGLAEIAALRADGMSIAIDDFGTGYSNIARLRAMPLDRVKLDPSLIADIQFSEEARTVVQAVIQLIKGVGAEVVAEASRISTRPTSCARWAATRSRGSSSPTHVRA
jgi:EAL domain-containing protein (putative c-di-GMP-specific phosphodiesterase class I)